MKNTLVGAFVLTLALLGGSAKAQTASDPTPAWQTTFFESPSVALPLLTAAVIRHSPQIKLLDIEKIAAQQDLQITKKGLLSAVGGGAAYSYGNQGGIATPDPTNPTQFTSNYASRYSAGVSVALSLGQLLTRHNLITRDKLNLQRNEVNRQEREDQIRQTVIQLYQNVVLSKKVLTLQQESYVTAQSSYRLTEKQFRQGQVALPDFSSATSQLSSAMLGLETARSQYETSFMLLEVLTGTKISTIMSAQ